MTQPRRSLIMGDPISTHPTRGAWIIGGAVALLVHGVAALPFLEEPAPPIIGVGPGDQGGIGIMLDELPPPLPPQPEPEPEPEEPEPEPEPEEEVIEEKSPEAPPPEAPPEPREEPRAPQPQPQPEPRDIWTGGGGDLTLEDYLSLEDWLRQAQAQVRGELRYPMDARRREIEGMATVVITVDRRGRVRDWEFIDPTGQPILDAEISRAMRRLRRLPPIPGSISHDRLRFIVPIRFQIVY